MCTQCFRNFSPGDTLELESSEEQITLKPGRDAALHLAARKGAAWTDAVTKYCAILRVAKYLPAFDIRRCQADCGKTWVHFALVRAGTYPQ